MAEWLQLLEHEQITLNGEWEKSMVGSYYNW